MGKDYHLIHADGTRTRISGAEKEQLLLRGELRPTTKPYVFISTARPVVFHSFADLRSYASPEVLRRYLGLNLIFELDGKRRRERELTPEGAALKLRDAGQPPKS